MKNLKNQQLLSAGYRENFAMENGKETTKSINGHKCLIYTYSEDVAYQDANGATYDTVTQKWID